MHLFCGSKGTVLQAVSQAMGALIPAAKLPPLLQAAVFVNGFLTLGSFLSYARSLMPGQGMAVQYPELCIRQPWIKTLVFHRLPGSFRLPLLHSIPLKISCSVCVLYLFLIVCLLCPSSLSFFA
jgi:hypothetical protein